MGTEEQAIVNMLREKINEHGEKIKSFQQAIQALISAESPVSVAAPAKNGRKRGRRRGRKRGRKAGSKNVVAPVVVKLRRERKTRKPRVAKKTRKPRAAETMEGWVLKQLADGTPKTSRTLMELYNKASGRKLEMNGFAARLSGIKKKGNVVSMKNPSDGLAYNGKADWFQNGKLKKDFLSKIGG